MLATKRGAYLNSSSTNTIKPRKIKNKRSGAPEERATFKSPIVPWLLLFPTLLILTAFIYYPAIKTLLLSIYQANLILNTQRFVGIGNFTDLLSSPAYQQVALQTLVFTVLTVGIGLLLSLSLAYLASRPIRGAQYYRLLLIFPYALSPAIAGTLWLFLFNPDIGLVNRFLEPLHLARRWLDDPFLAFGLVTVAAIWKGLGYNVVFYLAALQNMPTDVLEAAEIDGANASQRFWRIIFPLLTPMTFFLVFTNIISALFDSFALTDILTRGGPAYHNAGITTFLIYQLYEDGFINFKIGTAASQAALMLLLVAGITILQFSLGERKVHYGS